MVADTLLGVTGITLAYLAIGIGLIGTAWAAGPSINSFRRRLAQWFFFGAGYVFVGISIYLFLKIKGCI